MDSPSDPLNPQSSQIFPFGLYSSPPGTTPSAPRYPGGHAPSYPVMSHLLHSSGLQPLSTHRHRHADHDSTEEPCSNREVRDGEEDAGRGGVAASFPPLPQLLSGGKTAPSCEPGDWSRDPGSRKRACMESTLRRAGERGSTEGDRGPGGAERMGRKRRRGEARVKWGGREGRLQQRQELKVLLRETRGKLLELQQKVWRAYGDRRASGRGGHGDATRDLGTELFSEDEEVSERGGGVEKRSDDEQEDGPGSQQEVLGERRVWLGCGLVRGEWEANTDGGPKFAQALKHELGSAVARVIDRVTSLYAQNGPLNAVDSSLGERRSSKQEDTSRVNRAPRPSSGQTEALPLVLKRPQEKAGQNPAASETLLLPQPKPSLPPLPHGHVPAILPPPSKDPFLTSFPPAPPPLPLPLLHYTMQHLFTRSLSSMPMHKDCFSTDAFLDFSPHTSSFPPLPLLGQVDPPLPGSDRDGGSRRGPAGGLVGGYADSGDPAHFLPGGSSQEGLSPCHLKKAKLMFFYARYPSSNTLKTYFPDVKFNRCVTSQLIKWFSNFREFFYIQMERFARQAAREGVAGRGQGALRLGRDSELFRILNLHYNKSNDYQVPERFLEVSELALREFFSAIQAGRDTDPCWKKSIYKIICKLDSPVPDSFRLPGCPIGTSNTA